MSCANLGKQRENLHYITFVRIRVRSFITVNVRSFVTIRVTSFVAIRVVRQAWEAKRKPPLYHLRNDTCQIICNDKSLIVRDDACQIMSSDTCQIIRNDTCRAPIWGSIEKTSIISLLWRYVSDLGTILRSFAPIRVLQKKSGEAKRKPPSYHFCVVPAHRQGRPLIFSGKKTPLFRN